MPDANLDLVARLLSKLHKQRPALKNVDRYYSGTQPLQFLAPEILEQIGDRLTSLVLNWPRVVVDSVLRRLTPEGFKVGRGGDVDDDLWEIWQDNDLDEWSHLGLADALVHGRSFLLVWANESGDPRITVESAEQMVVLYAPGERREVRAALKAWSEDGVEHATLYLPDEIVKYTRRAMVTSTVLWTPDQPQSQGLGGWTVEETLSNPLGVVPVVPLVNRARTMNLDGVSDLADIIGPADAVNKLATDMMVTSEFYVTPRRHATGIQIPQGPGGRERTQAEIAAWWDNATKGKTWLAGPGVAFGQFEEASLEGFVKAIHLLTSVIAAIGGLPPDDLGLNTTNPASAEARRAADTTLVMRAKGVMRPAGGAYEQAMRIAVAVRDAVRVDEIDPALRRMTTVWADPQVPAIAQTMDAAVKGVEAGIYDAVQGQEQVGLDPQQRAAIAARVAEAAERETGAATARELAEMVQKVYLGVGTVLTAKEARALLNRAGAGLDDNALSAPAA